MIIDRVRIYRMTTYTAELDLADLARLTGESIEDVRANVAAGTLDAFLADYATPELNDAVNEVSDQEWSHHPTVHPELIAVRRMVKLVHARVPGAAFINLGWSDQGGNTMTPGRVLDAELNEITDFTEGMPDAGYLQGIEWEDLSDYAATLRDVAESPWTEFRVYPWGHKYGDINAEEMSCIDIAKVVRAFGL